MKKNFKLIFLYIFLFFKHVTYNRQCFSQSALKGVCYNCYIDQLIWIDIVSWSLLILFFHLDLKSLAFLPLHK